MATLTLYIKGGYKNPQTNNKGESLLYWKYVHREQSVLYSTKCTASPSHLNWVAKRGKQTIDRYEPLVKSTPAASLKNKNVKSQGEILESIVESIKLEKSDPTIARVREWIDRSKQPKGKTDFFLFTKEIAALMFENGQISRSQKYIGVADKAQLLLNRTKLDLSEFSLALIEKYKKEAKNKEGNKSTTIDADLKVIRSVLNNAIAQRLIKEKPSFKNLISNNDSTGKIGLDLDQLKKLILWQPPLNSSEFHAKNVWLFSFFNAGIRIGDLLQLSWRNIYKDRISYTMAKTRNSKRPNVSFQLNTSTQKILDSYRDTKNGSGNSLIFPLLREDIAQLVLNHQISDRGNIDPKIISRVLRDVSAKTTSVNKTLKRISKILFFENARLTTHLARHTYSQIAVESGKSLEDLSHLLNHSATKTTEIYTGNARNTNIDKMHQSVIKEVNDFVNL